MILHIIAAIAHRGGRIKMTDKSYYEFSSDDEIDSFHKNKDLIDIVTAGESKGRKIKEVYGIYDSTDSDEFDEKASTSKLTNNWGGVRKVFYGHSTADDAGDREDQELLEIEEEEAINRQKKLDSFSNIEWTSQKTEKKGMEFFSSLKESLNSIRSRINTRVEKKQLKRDEVKQKHIEKEIKTSKDNNGKASRRAITYEMKKNKGIRQNSRHNNDYKHARVKKRKQYQKALIRRRSQVPDVKKEISRYDGEKRGIRSNVIRSIKL